MRVSFGNPVHISSLLKAGQWGLSLAVLVFPLIAPNSSALAAVKDARIETIPAQPHVEVDALLLAIQSLLAEMGVYHGALDGRLNEATSDAIRLHQKAWNLRQTGLPSEDLLQHLEMVAGMRRIERRLLKTKAEQISGAKRLIEESPATRRLLMEAAARPLPQIKDPQSCFDDPKPECLSVLARQAALAAPAGSMRDWALSEVASEAAEAGVHQMAWEVASRIDDPRTLIAALESVARALAQGGYFQAALESLEAIPDLSRRCEAALTLALRQAEVGQTGNARAARAAGERLLDHLKQPEESLAARLKLSEIALSLGESGAATRWRVEAERRLLSLPLEGRQSAMASLSMIETTLKHFDASRQWLVQVQDGLLRVPAELKLIEALARANRGMEAEAMARSIDLARYRVLAHVRLARVYFSLGRKEDAERQLRSGSTLVQAIDLPFARAYGESQVALGWMLLGDFQIAEAQALAIGDEAIKAQTLWRLADFAPQDRIALLHLEAEAATKAYADPFGRVWMFAELVRERTRQGDPQNAKAHLLRGIKVAGAITDSWSRSRALAALAGAMAEMRKP